MTPNEANRLSEKPECTAGGENRAEHTPASPDTGTKTSPRDLHASTEPTAASAASTSAAAGSKQTTSSTEVEPSAEAGVDRSLDGLRTELDGFRRTLDRLKLRADPGEADLVANLEQHYTRLQAEFSSIEKRASGTRFSRREWETATKEASLKMRRGASELGGGLGRAWREISSAAGKAWGELRSPNPEPRESHPSEPPRSAPRDV